MTWMKNFFYGLHFVVALAESTSEVLKQWELIQSPDLPVLESQVQLGLFAQLAKRYTSMGQKGRVPSCLCILSSKM